MQQGSSACQRGRRRCSWRIEKFGLAAYLTAGTGTPYRMSRAAKIRSRCQWSNTKTDGGRLFYFARSRFKRRNAKEPGGPSRLRATRTITDDRAQYSVHPPPRGCAATCLSLTHPRVGGCTEYCARSSVMV